MGKKSGRWKWRGAFLLALSVLSLPMAQAQEFPTKPITLVVPVGAGGSHDLTARAITSAAPDYLGQPIIVQLKPGANGAIGSDFVAKAAPDGYTLLFGGPAWSTTMPAVDNKSKGPDDLVAVCRINYSPMVVGIRGDAPFKTLKQMLEWCKANPGKLMVGGYGGWSKTELFWKQVNKESGITVRGIPYDGGGPALMAMIGGHIDTTCGLAAAFMPYIKTGKVIATALLDNKRDRDLPDVPTAKEEGVDSVQLMWRGVLAPKNTPRPIIEKLAAGFKKMTENPSVLKIIQGFGDEINYLGPDEFGKVWRAEYNVDKELGKMFKK